MKKSKLLSGSELIAMLPEDVQQNLIDTMVDLAPIGEAEDIKVIKEGEFLNMADMLASSFRWDMSQSGREYWEGIINQSLDGKDLEQCLDEIIEVKLVKTKKLIAKKLKDALKELLEDDADSLFETNGEYSGAECLAQLSAEEQNKFHSNYVAFRTENEYKAYIESNYNSFRDFISCAFAFFASKEGFEYWSDIRNRDVLLSAKSAVNEVLEELDIPTSNGKV